ncbi:hypothetical protein LXL04_022456 [Taraxacum kok-saghyz]
MHGEHGRESNKGPNVMFNSSLGGNEYCGAPGQFNSGQVHSFDPPDATHPILGSSRPHPVSYGKSAGFGTGDPTGKRKILKAKKTPIGLDTNTRRNQAAPPTKIGIDLNRSISPSSSKLSKNPTGSHQVSPHSPTHSIDTEQTFQIGHQLGFQFDRGNKESMTNL